MSILEKIDRYLTEATKPTFEEFCSKNTKMIEKFWKRMKNTHTDDYEDDDDGRISRSDEEAAEEAASEKTIKKFKNKFAFDRKDIDDYMDFLFTKFGS